MSRRALGAANPTDSGGYTQGASAEFRRCAVCCTARPLSDFSKRGWRCRQCERALRKMRDAAPERLASERERNRHRREDSKPLPPGWWSRLSDHERAEWLREKARTV